MNSKHVKTIVFISIFLLISFVVIEFILIRSNSNKSTNQKVILTPTNFPTLASGIPSITSESSHLSQIEKQSVKVTRVIDGDTIEIEGNIKVRYIGIDAPETVDPKRPEGCYGKEVSDKNKELVEGKLVTLEKDVSNTDKYGRLLRYVYVGNIFVNEYLVKEGYAKIDTYPPDVRYVEKFITAQKEARKNNKGLWGNCNPSPTRVIR